MEEKKAWYKSKTTWFGVIHLAALAALKIFGVDLTESVGDMTEGLVTAIVAVEGIVIIVLRAVTRTRIGREPGWKPPGGVNMLLALCLAGVLAMAVCGCNSVNMTPEYSALVDSTAAWSRVMAEKAAAGEMTEAEMTEALEINADLWGKFGDAKNGVVTDGGGR